jgi:hypothetical protein
MIEAISETILLFLNHSFFCIYPYFEAVNYLSRRSIGKNPSIIV